MRHLRSTLAVLLLTTLSLSPLLATCGGGGGGGMGGMASGGMSAGGGISRTYQVPWVVLGPGQKGAAKEGLIVYWLPPSVAAAKGSDMQTSRTLALLSGHCVNFAIVTPDNDAMRGQLAVTDKVDMAVLTTADGKEIGRAMPDGAKALNPSQVEKLVNGEIKSREQGADRKLSQASEKEKSGDADGAVALYSTVYGDRCLVPGSAKKAAKALKKLGKPVDEKASELAPLPNLSPDVNARMERTLAAGLAAENDGRYAQAKELYRRANLLDPHDPIALRFLAELERHHLGDWAAAKRDFAAVLAMKADPISRAVALHGLGKMTIHGGEFAQGLALFEQSIATYPLPLTYRNLAVYWNSEGQVEKAQGFVKQALALAPDDPYNQIFAAAFAVEDGRRDEALRIAQANE
ncbi:MAG TPA: tetratricopeptide repeat protein, partial [Thermoanaerobaculia bacterium]